MALTFSANEVPGASVMQFNMKLASVAVTKATESGQDAKNEAVLRNVTRDIIGNLYQQAKEQGIAIPDGSPAEVIPDKVSADSLAQLIEMLSGE